MHGDILLNEEGFYNFYEDYKEKLNQFFHKCMKKKYGNF